MLIKILKTKVSIEEMASVGLSVASDKEKDFFFKVQLAKLQ